MEMSDEENLKILKVQKNIEKDLDNRFSDYYQYILKRDKSEKKIVIGCSSTC